MMSARACFVQQLHMASKQGRKLMWQIADDRKLSAITKAEVHFKEVQQAPMTLHNKNGMRKLLGGNL